MEERGSAPPRLGRPRRQDPPAGHAPLGRRAAAGRRRAGAREPADDHPRRRADGQPGRQERGARLRHPDPPRQGQRPGRRPRDAQSRHRRPVRLHPADAGRPFRLTGAGVCAIRWRAGEGVRALIPRAKAIGWKLRFTTQTRVRSFEGDSSDQTTFREPRTNAKTIPDQECPGVTPRAVPWPGGRRRPGPGQPPRQQEDGQAISQVGQQAAAADHRLPVRGRGHRHGGGRPTT